MPSNINQKKDTAQTWRPILLCVWRFLDGTFLRLATVAVTYGGNTYAARIDEQEIERLAALSEQGIDRVPSVNIRIADPDAFYWTNYERAAGKGFKGSDFTLTFVLQHLPTGEFSTDNLVPFTGICDKPSVDEKFLTVSANSKLNLAKYFLPTPLIQRNCMWINPVTASQRAEADNPESRYFPCGETLAVTPCSYTKATCTRPLRFSGLLWEPERTGSGREYISGSKVEWRNADTSAKLRSYVPLWLGGSAWLQAVVANQVADGSYTRGEAIVGIGAIEVDRVIVNGVELSMSRSGDFRWHYVNQGGRDGTPNTDRPYNGNGDGYPSQTAIQFLATKAVISPDSEANVRVLGRRKTMRVYRRIVSITGGVVTFDGPNQDCAGNPPFTVTIVGNSGVNGTFELTSWAFGPPGTITLSGSTGSGTGGYLYYEVSGVLPGSPGGASTPWAIMEALRWTRYEYSDLDPMTFADTAKIGNTDYTYTDQNGVTATQPRFSTALALRERRPASEIVRGLRQSIGALLVPGPDGKLRLQLEGPLAEQQPAPVDGSNYDTGIASTLRTGTTANGYLAYLFDESNCWGLKVNGQSVSDSPNRVSFQFSDPANGFAVSTFALVDPDSVQRIDHESPGGLAVEPEGIASINQSLRVGKLGLAKLHRGNPFNDARGTDLYEWQCSFRGVKLAIGQIVGQTNARLGLDKQQIRLTEIKPSRNFETMTLRGHFHSDDWYLDSHGNAADPGYSSSRTLRRGLPAPWAPYYVHPTATGNATYDKPGSLFDESDWTFGLRLVYDINADGPIAARIEAVGRHPITETNSLSPPLLARQGTTATSGGSIPGAAGIAGGIRRLYVALSSRDSSGKRSPLSEPCVIDITATTDLNTVTATVASWDPDTDYWFAYAGWSPMNLTLAGEGAGKPASVTLTSINLRGDMAPDNGIAKLRVQVKESIHSGPWAALVTAVGAGTITCADLIDGTDNWGNRDLAVIADGSDGEADPWNFRATAYDKTTGQFTVIPPPTDIQVGDVLVIRAQATTATATTIGDGGFVNKFATSGLTVNGEAGNLVRIIAGKGRGQVRRIVSNTATVLTVEPAFDEAPDATSRFIVEAPDWQFGADATLAPNSTFDALITLKLPLQNWLKRVGLVRVLTVDANGIESAESLAPIREIYLYGQPPGTVTVTADYTVKRGDRVVLVDTTAGPVNVTFPPGEEIAGLRTLVQLITNGSTDTPPGNNCTILPAAGELISGAANVVLNKRWQSEPITGSAE